MGVLSNLVDAARLAINRMPVFSEKEKRLAHVALDATATDCKSYADTAAILAFPGIDDNTTGEVLNLEDTWAGWGSGGNYTLGLQTNGASLWLTGGNASGTDGARIRMIGGAAIGGAGTMQFYNGTTVTLEHEPAGNNYWDFQANNIVTTGDIYTPNFYATANGPNDWINLSFGDSTNQWRAGLTYGNGTRGGKFEIWTGRTGIDLYSADSASPGDFRVYDNTTTTLYFDAALNQWDFSTNEIIGVTGIKFDEVSPPAHAEGLVFFDTTTHTLNYYNDETDVTVNLGEENLLRIYNNSGVALADGDAVKISGAFGTLPTVSKAVATTGTSPVVGIVTHSIPNGSIGYITTFGIVRDVDTSGFVAGDLLYLSSATSGAITNVAPSFPNKVIQIGSCITSDVATGTIFVDIDQGTSRLTVSKSYTFASRAATSGQYYQAGYYQAPAAAATLTQASPTITVGAANASHAAHAFMVSGGIGTTDGSDLWLTASGVSILDDGTLNLADSEVLSTTLNSTTFQDQYLETSKKWLGAVTFTLSSPGGGTTFSFSFNYGLAKYEDLGNIDGTIRSLECVGLCNASDAGFNIQLLYHNSSGWTYSAGAFVPGNTPILDMNVDHGTPNNIVAGEHFAYKRTGVDQAMQSSQSEGLVIRITTTTNNAVSYMDSHLTATIP